MSSTRQAIINLIKNDATLRALGVAAAQVLTPGRITVSTPSPWISVERGRLIPIGRHRPFYTELWDIKVGYSAQSRGGSRWVETDSICDRIRELVSGATLDVADGYIWEFEWISTFGDSRDMILQVDYRVERFAAYRTTSYRP